jgi:hypothetical protein
MPYPAQGRALNRYGRPIAPEALPAIAMADAAESADRGGLLESIGGELAEIKHLLVKATAELEHGNLSDARKVLLSARCRYETMSKQVAATLDQGPDEQRRLFVLRLEPMNRAIHRLERRLAAHTPPL